MGDGAHLDDCCPGCALTLAWLWTYAPAAAQVSLLFFVATGAPMIVRSLVLEFQERERIRNQ